MIRPAAVILSFSIIFSTFFHPVVPLKLNVTPKILPLQVYNKSALREVFIDLIEQKKYDLVYDLLDMKTFDSSPGYYYACSTFTREDYKDIMEYFYAKNEIHKLELILPPECIMVMDKRIFYEPVTLYSLRDLPMNLFAIDSNGMFNFRTKSNRFAFCKIVSHALDHRFTNVNWDNMVHTNHFLDPDEKIRLSEVFTACQLRPEIEMDLFYYLSPTMLPDCNYQEDVLWLVRFALPRVKLIPLVKPEVKFVEPKILTIWNEILFRTVTTLSFYFELNEMLRVLVRRPFKQSTKTSLEASRDAAQNTLVDLNRIVAGSLQLKSICKPLNDILTILNELHILFIVQDNSLSRFGVNRLFKSIVWMFEKFAPYHIQGDWMYNLFYLFWKRKFSALRTDDINYSLSVFFSKNPTVYAINKVYLVHSGGYQAILTFGSRPAFDQTIPEDRLLDVYKKYPHMLESRYSEIDFSIRLRMMVKIARDRFSSYNSNAVGSVTFQAIPHLPENIAANPSSPAPPAKITGEEFSFKRKLIKVFESTILAMHRESVSSLIYSYGRYKKIEKNFQRNVDIRDCLKQFFDLILLIKDFRMISANHFSPADSRPVIIVTPLISKNVANVFGQALILSAILDVNVPFIIDPRQLRVIFNYEKPDNSLMREINTFCNRPNYLNYLSNDAKNNNNNELRTFARRLSRYFESFYLWSTLFNKMGIEKSEEIIYESFKNCNSQIFYGVKLHINASKFSYDELIEILFKIKLE